jgi:hypothetical protein
MPEPEWDIYTPGNYTADNHITAETIIKGVAAENKIISTSVNLSCEIKIEEAYFDLNIFRKSQVLWFHGTALYTISLENLSEQDIYIGESFIKVYIEKPELYALNLNAEKTIAERVQRGILRFGNIEITPEDYKTMQVLAISQMNEQLGGEDIKLITRENAKKAADDFFQSVLSLLTEEDMTVEINFK